MLRLIFGPRVILLLIVFVAIFFRFYDLNWDQGQHLHPDERFLTMVGVDMKLPRSLGDYLNPAVSTFNPANIKYPFYVYGTFPVVLNKLLAMQFNEDNYTAFTLQGRLLSAFADLMVVILVFKTMQLLEKRHKLNPHIKYWGALFYAVAVLPIQLAHFFAVDTFLNTFVFAAFYCALRLSVTRHRRWLFLSSIFFGLAIGCKVTAIFILPLLLYCFLLTHINRHNKRQHQLLAIGGDLLLFGVGAYIVGRLADPYLFQSNNFFDPRISKLLLQNLKELAAWSNPQALYPPG
ncbi:MAG: ArnT family glycosyltransferase, partial [Candidatus Levyibacteriota bacterium]